MAKKKKNRKWIYLLILIVLSSSAGYYFKFKNKTQIAEKVAVEKAIERTIVETVYSSGKLFPATELEITSNVSGTIVELFVKDGDAVKKGQLLAKIDPEALVSIVERTKASTEGSRAQLQAVKAQKKQLEAQFDNTKIIYKRNKKLFEDGVISKAEFEAAEATYNTALANLEAADQNILAAEFSVKSAEATVKEQEKNLSQTRIYAPINGVVSTLYKKQGEQVVGTAQMAGTPILKIANLNTVEVRVDVNERDILTINQGDSAAIELDAYPDRKFAGIVTQIANTATGLTSLTSQLTSDQITNFEVRILMLPDSYYELQTENDKSPFRAGLSASAEIITNTALNILSVPVAAVTAKEDEADQENIKKEAELKEYVFILKGDSVEMRTVVSGIQNDNYIEIIKGLEPGEEIVTAPYDAISKILKQGSRVEVVEESALYKQDKK